MVLKNFQFLNFFPLIINVQSKEFVLLPLVMDEVF